MRKIALLLSLCAITGCGTVGGDGWDYGRLRASCRSDGGARWIGAPPANLDGILLVNTIKDPSHTGGRLVPDQPHSYAGAQEQWLMKRGLRFVNLYLKPTQSPEQNPRSVGPFVTDPEGVYRFELAPASDPKCRTFIERYERFRAAEFLRGAAAYAYPDLTHCTPYTYAGPLDVSAYPYVYVWWFDRSVEAAGVQRTVHEIRDRSGTPVGRAVFYAGLDPLRWAPECFHHSTTFEGWFPDDAVTDKSK